MAISSELKMKELAESKGLNVKHSLTKNIILDELKKNPSKKALQILKDSENLPRARKSFEIDLVIWNEENNYCLAVEEKTQFNSKKTLVLDNDGMLMHNQAIELQKNLGNLISQAKGEAMLAEAYMLSQNLNKKALPIAVIDYEIEVHGMKSKFAVHENVLFVQKKYFNWFLDEYLENSSWISTIVQL